MSSVCFWWYLKKYHLRHVRCMPEVVPSKYHLRHVRCTPQVVPIKYHLSHVGSMPQVVPSKYHVVSMAEWIQQVAHFASRSSSEALTYTRPMCRFRGRADFQSGAAPLASIEREGRARAYSILPPSGSQGELYLQTWFSKESDQKPHG